MKKYASFMSDRSSSVLRSFHVESKFATRKLTDEYGFNGPLIVYIFACEETLCNVRHIAHSL